MRFCSGDNNIYLKIFGFKFGSVFFALREKNCAGVILPFVEYDWFSWSNDNTTHKETWFRAVVVNRFWIGTPFSTF